MRNYINTGLAANRDIGSLRSDNLNHLHFIMDCVLLTSSDKRSGHVGSDTEFAAAVEFLEYLMQDEWGFGRDATRHTHCTRLEACFLERNGETADE